MPDGTGRVNFIGARMMMALSTSRSDRKPLAVVGPPSTNTCSIPRFPHVKVDRNVASQEQGKRKVVEPVILSCIIDYTRILTNDNLCSVMFKRIPDRVSDKP